MTLTEIETMTVLDKIYEANDRLKNVVIHTPTVPSNILSNEKKGAIFFKLENLQRTGSFKIRGAYNKMSQLTEEEKSRGVIGCSAGNHAQGMAISGEILGISTRIFMPKTAPQNKIQSTEKYGAKVELVGDNFDETKEAALKEASRTGEIFVPPYDDLEVIAGQGTVGYEIFYQLEKIDNIIVPIGGGGLIAGIATIAKALHPEIKIIGVQTFNVHGMLSSIWNHEITQNRSDRTVADGCDVSIPGELTYKILEPLIDETVLVEEEEIKQAITYLAIKEKIVAEGAGALTAAAIMSGKMDAMLLGKTTVAVVSGGNIDMTDFKEVL